MRLFEKFYVYNTILSDIDLLVKDFEQFLRSFKQAPL